MCEEYQYAGKAMGTDFSIALVGESKILADTLAQQIIEKIHSYEIQFSRFTMESELSQLNTQRDMVVSETFLLVTLEAYRLFVETKGIFNPLFQIEKFGYTQSFETLSTETLKVAEEPYNIDFATTSINQDTRRITLRDGQRLDFGGFLKGYVATQLCKMIKNYSPSLIGIIINIGGDLHTEGVDAEGHAFVFEIYNPITQSDIPITLTNTSLATSGTYKRRWNHNGREIHHILDASGTKNPDTDIVSASVIHSEGATADAYAKVFLSVGAKQACAMLHDARVSYIIITKNGDVERNIL